MAAEHEQFSAEYAIDSRRRRITGCRLAIMERLCDSRFDNSHNRVALLNYLSFFEDAFGAGGSELHIQLLKSLTDYFGAASS